MAASISSVSRRKDGTLTARSIAKLERWQLLNELRRHIWPGAQYQQACRMTTKYLRYLLIEYESPQSN